MIQGFVQEHGFPAVADMLEAMLFLAPEKDRVKLVRGTLSAGELSRVIEDLEQGSAGLIGVAMGEESPSFCAVFATLRKLIADRYSQEKKDRLKAIYGRRSTYLSEEMERGDMEGFRLPEAYDPGEEFPASASLFHAFPLVDAVIAGHSALPNRASSSSENLSRLWIALSAPSGIMSGLWM